MANDRIETPKEVLGVIEKALQFVPRNKLFPCTNCGMAPMSREVAAAKLRALAAGAALARKKYRAAKSEKLSGKGNKTR